MKNGYTLIEILITLTIIGLIFGFGYVSFREFSRRQALTSAARSIKGDLRLAQELALSGNKPTMEINCNSPYVLNGYYFRRNSATNYTIEPSCSGGAVTTPTKSVNMPVDIVITSLSVNPILFKILGEGNNITDSATITLTQTSTGKTGTITITSGGEIK
jgi:prepilin-type N-terminal cleavage/methylation domain-containing protein